MKPIPRFRCTECEAVSSPVSGTILHAWTCSFVTRPDSPPPPAEMISEEEAASP